MTYIDIAIAICSVGLVITTIPTLRNKASQVPRLTSSIPIAVCLSVMVPFFYLQGDTITSITLCGQAAVWWLIAKYRPVRPKVSPVAQTPLPQV